MALYPWLESVLEEQYRPVCRLRKTERNEIVLLEQKERHVRIVKRIFAGGSDVYRKLLTLKHKNMPEILEVTEFGDRTLVLEEYIDGVTLWDLMQEEGYYTEKAWMSSIIHTQNAVSVSWASERTALNLFPVCAIWMRETTETKADSCTVPKRWHRGMTAATFMLQR